MWGRILDLVLIAFVILAALFLCASVIWVAWALGGV
jgi:hypothetical protein